jgi:hypothetical protein
VCADIAIGALTFAPVLFACREVLFLRVLRHVRLSPPSGNSLREQKRDDVSTMGTDRIRIKKKVVKLTDSPFREAEDSTALLIAILPS